MLNVRHFWLSVATFICLYAWSKFSLVKDSPFANVKILHQVLAVGRTVLINVDLLSSWNQHKYESRHISMLPWAAQSLWSAGSSSPSRMCLWIASLFNLLSKCKGNWTTFAKPGFKLSLSLITALIPCKRPSSFLKYQKIPEILSSLCNDLWCSNLGQLSLNLSN